MERGLKIKPTEPLQVIYVLQLKSSDIFALITSWPLSLSSISQFPNSFIINLAFSHFTKQKAWKIGSNFSHKASISQKCSNKQKLIYSQISAWRLCNRKWYPIKAYCSLFSNLPNLKNSNLISSMNRIFNESRSFHYRKLLKCKFII